MALPDTGTIANLTRCLRLPGFFPVGFVDEFLRVLPFQDASGYGPSVQINAATDLGSVGFYAAGGTIPATNWGATSLTTFTFARIGGVAQVDDADIAASADPNDQLEIQVAMRKIALLRTLSPNLLFGDGIGANIRGLATWIHDTLAQEIDLAGAAPTLKDYHRLVALVRASDGALGTGADALVMNFNARRQLTSLLEAAGGATYERDEALGVPVLRFEGLPVYVTEGIPLPGPNTTIFAVKLKGPSGVRVLHVGGSSQEFGIVVDEVPNQMTVNQRAKIVRGYYAVMLPEVKSAAAILNASMAGFNP